MYTITKPLLRKTILQYRKLLDEGVFEVRNRVLLEKLSRFVIDGDYRSIHAFLPIRKNREPDVQPVLLQFLKQGRRVVIPKTDFQNRRMDHFYYRENTVLQENALGIPEPLHAEPADVHTIDLVIVPLVCADKKGNRIGYGGGFYDRFLARKEVMKVGLSLSPLLDEIGQAEAWDERVDYIIS